MSSVDPVDIPTPNKKTELIATTNEFINTKEDTNDMVDDSSSSLNASNFKDKKLPYRSLKSKNNYKELGLLGEGTFGVVYLAEDNNGIRYALKRINIELEKEGFPLTALREIKILQSLCNHPNIVKLIEVITDNVNWNNNPGTYLVFEYLDHDLTGLRNSEDVGSLHPSQMRYYLKQLLQAVYYLHKCNILHRDIKGANILIDKNHNVKLADFGLSRTELIKPYYTNRVVTLWYRAPELLLGSYEYDNSVDMWSVGCVFSEMVNRKPLCNAGPMELAQLQAIFNICGTPDISDWPEVVKLPWWNRFQPQTPLKRKISDEFKELMPAIGLDLLERLLCLNPKKRLTAQEALSHPYFYEDSPELPLKFNYPMYNDSYHEIKTKKKKLAAPPEETKKKSSKHKKV